MEQKNLYIIAGCNGAGKTTASFTILPEILDCKEFVNAEKNLNEDIRIYNQERYNELINYYDKRNKPGEKE